MLTAEENELLTHVGPGTPCGDMLRPLSCNWLQCEENTGDVTHTYFLHGRMMAKRGLRGRRVLLSTVRPVWIPALQVGFAEGLDRRGPRGGLGWGNLLVFPNMLRP